MNEQAWILLAIRPNAKSLNSLLLTPLPTQRYTFGEAECPMGTPSGPPNVLAIPKIPDGRNISNHAHLDLSFHSMKYLS